MSRPCPPAEDTKTGLIVGAGRSQWKVSLPLAPASQLAPMQLIQNQLMYGENLPHSQFLKSFTKLDRFEAGCSASCKHHAFKLRPKAMTAVGGTLIEVWFRRVC